MKDVGNTPGRESTHSWEFKAGSEQVIINLAQKGRKYTVTSAEIVGHEDLVPAFSPQGPGVEDLDEDSDAQQCFGVSMSVRVDGIALNFTEMTARSPEELKAAFSKVKIRVFNPEEI